MSNIDLSRDDEAEPSSLFKLSDSDIRLASLLTKAVAAASHFQPIMNNRRMGKALSKNNAAQRRLIFDRWKKKQLEYRIGVY